MTAFNQDDQVNAIESISDDGEERSIQGSITHFDYIHDDASNEDKPRFVLKLQNTIESLDMEKMLGMDENQFYSGSELDRATKSSYRDMNREIVLPRRELESVLSCVYTDISAELTLPDKILHYYTTPVNDFTDLIVKQKFGKHPVFTIITFVGRVRQRSLVSRRAAVQTYFNNRANIDTYLSLLNL